jgi:hypothetical protein
MSASIDLLSVLFLEILALCFSVQLYIRILQFAVDQRLLGYVVLVVLVVIWFAFRVRDVFDNVAVREFGG